MAERVIAFVVVLEDTIRADDAKDVIGLLSLIRGVSSVRPVPEDMSSVIARDRAASAVREDILRVLGLRT
jgi:hypothetical protein